MVQTAAKDTGFELVNLAHYYKTDQGAEYKALVTKAVEAGFRLSVKQYPKDPYNHFVAARAWLHLEEKARAAKVLDEGLRLLDQLQDPAWEHLREALIKMKEQAEGERTAMGQFECRT